MEMENFIVVFICPCKTCNVNCKFTDCAELLDIIMCFIKLLILDLSSDFIEQLGYGHYKSSNSKTVENLGNYDFIVAS